MLAATVQANDQVIVGNISNDPTSFGWVGFAFFEENAASLKAIEVDNGESGCVAPTTETIASFEHDGIPFAGLLFYGILGF